MSRPRPAIPRWRKALYALVPPLVLLAALQAVALWLEPDLPEPPGTYPHLEAYLGDVREKAGRIEEHPDDPLPGAQALRVLWRVSPDTEGAEAYEDAGGATLTLPLAELPLAGNVVLLGGSAAYGYRLPYRDSVGAQLQELLRQSSGRPELQVINLARPSWELNSVVALALNLLAHGERPAAVVVYSGNNEFLAPGLFGLGKPLPERFALGRMILHYGRYYGLIRPPPDADPDFFKYPDWLPPTPEVMAARIWWPGRGLDDASFWTEVRAVHLAQFRRSLRRLGEAMRLAGVPLVLVPPPINLVLFPGGGRYQPATYRPVGRWGYERIASRLQGVLRENRLEAAQQMVRDEPGGSLQRYQLATLLEAEGRHAEAQAHYLEARERSMGLLGSLRTLARLMAEEGPPRGAKVIDTGGWYHPDRPTRPQARALFLDACHLTARGSNYLARHLEPLLARLLR